MLYHEEHPLGPKLRTTGALPREAAAFDLPRRTGGRAPSPSSPRTKLSLALQALELPWDATEPKPKTQHGWKRNRIYPKLLALEKLQIQCEREKTRLPDPS